MVCCLLESSSLEALFLDIGTRFLIVKNWLVPYEPGTTIRFSAILFPRSKVMTTYKNGRLVYERRKVNDGM